ncbi:MAG: hypothetical protein A2Z93_00500 [Curvibacter sp. GWA2_64_110]|nr:MAG: hypothetical protein A2Z93_00500 [Curvibacter sp. GWA2_64_110]HCY17095.1 hypothetical protein [Curvibacter sp.]
MRIAFTSCASTNLVPDQPIWDDIRTSAPKHVVLLGDNFYNDVPDVGMDALQKMTTNQFVEHMLTRYWQQFNEPHFRKLVEAPGITLHAIWDDHDFAWNDAAGGPLLADPKQAEKIRVSTNFMRAFRKALAAKDLSVFPTASNASELWTDFDKSGFQRLGATSIQLETDGRCWLHLTDGRSFRKKPQILGAAQRKQLGEIFKAYPDALHIIASGVTFNQGDGWHKYPTDRAWLAEAVGDHNWLMLSGDIHKNFFDEHPLSNKGHLVEATASGAAIHAYLNGLIKGPEVRNHGLLDIDPDKISIQLLAFNQSITKNPWTYQRTAGGDLIVT